MNPPILPWYTETANAVMHQSRLRPLTRPDVERIVAAHDPAAAQQEVAQHEVTVRLLEKLLWAVTAKGAADTRDPIVWSGSPDQNREMFSAIEKAKRHLRTLRGEKGST